MVPATLSSEVPLISSTVQVLIVVSTAFLLVSVSQHQILHSTVAAVKTMKEKDATWEYVTARLIEEDSSLKTVPTATKTQTFPENGKIASIRTKEIICKRCGIIGHLAEECRQPWEKIKQRRNENINSVAESNRAENEKAKARLATLSLGTHNFSSNKKLTVDSHGPEHICHQKDVFINLINVPSIEIQVVDGRKLIATQKGSIAVQLLTETGKEASKVILRSVYYLPALQMSVLSVTQLLKSGISVVFASSKVRFIGCDNKSQSLGYGFLSSASLLFEVNISMPTSKGTANTCSRKNGNEKESYYLWHARLGHIGRKPISKMM